jgi:hypothetical protein
MYRLLTGSGIIPLLKMTGYFIQEGHPMLIRVRGIGTCFKKSFQVNIMLPWIGNSTSINYKKLAVIFVQCPKPVEIIFADKATVICPVCKQEVIIKDNTKERDIVVCSRCQAKFRILKTKDGKWESKQI